MPEAEVTKKTRWGCQRCGDCCLGLILKQNQSLSVLKNGKSICKFLSHDNLSCSEYLKRPFICRVYPFIIDFDKAIVDGKAKPQNAFMIENLRIHTECPGYGGGKRVFGNNNLRKTFEKLGYDFAMGIQAAIREGKDISGII